MASVFATSQSSWHNIVTVTHAAEGVQAPLSGPPSAMTIASFTAASRAEQVAFLMANGATADGASIEISGDGGDPFVLTLRSGTGGQDYVTIQQKGAAGETQGLIGTAGQDESLIPYYNLSTGGLNAFNSATAEALFPAIDGIAVTLPESKRPAGFELAPADLDTPEKQAQFLAAFATWHSAHQIEWVNAHAVNGILTIPQTVPVGETPVRTFVLSPAVGEPVAGNVFPASDYSARPRLYQVETLSKNVFATMPAADQARIAGTAGFDALASSLGLSRDPAVKQLVSTLRDRITGYTADQRGGASLPAEAQEAFLGQLAILEARLDRMSIYSALDIEAQVKEIESRFERLAAFFNVADESIYSERVEYYDTVYYLDLPKGVVSNDQNATINSGYQVFLTQEKRIRDLMEARAQVASSGVIDGRKVDAPVLIYYFQNQYNLEVEAKVVSETEEIRQQNAYLKTVADMQRLVNDAIRRFESADGDNKTLDLDRFIMVYAFADFSGGSPHPSDMPPGQVLNDPEAQQIGRIIAMFDRALGGAQPHPLEALRGLTRPLMDLTRGRNVDLDDRWELTYKSHPQWSQFGTQLSELVTLVNQESQLKMNDITSMDKQRNRHYDLANSALSKMSDLVASIARLG